MEVYALSGINGEQSFLLFQTGAGIWREMNLTTCSWSNPLATYQFRMVGKKVPKRKGPDWRQQDRLGVLLSRPSRSPNGRVIRMIHGSTQLAHPEQSQTIMPQEIPTDGSFLLSTTAAV